MSLLLCFFVMLFAISNIIDAKWEALIKTMEGKMGYTGKAKNPSSGVKPATAVFSVSERSRRTAALRGAQTVTGKGQQDYQQQMTMSGDIVKGGLIRFGLGNDDLDAQAKKDLEKLYPTLLASSQKIMVKGYVAPTEIESGYYSRDYFLAHARAINVMDYLIELGLKKEYFQVSVSDSATIPNRLILPVREQADPKLAGASAAVYLISDTSRPPDENGEP
jgi:flagellar motor protein MotB